MKGFESTIDGAQSDDLECLNSLRKAFDLCFAEVAVFEHVSENQACLRLDNDRVGFGQGLHSSRQVGRLADDAPLLSLTRSGQIADDHEPRCDPDAYLKPAGRKTGRLESAGLDDGEGGPHCPFSIVLVRPRITEIDQDAIAHVLRHEAAERIDRIRDTRVIGVDYIMEIFRVESRSERR